MSRRRRVAAPVAVAAIAVSLGAGVLATAGGDDALAPARLDALHPEQPLVQSLFDVSGGRIDDALGSLSRLVRRQPDFALARVVYADLLAAKSGRLDGLGLLGSDSQVAGLRHEALARLGRYLDAPPTAGQPAELLQLPERVGTVLLVDLRAFRLYRLVNRGGRPVRQDDYYVSIGKGGSDKRREGDEKTPVGVYRVDDYLPGSRLPDMYGEGAFPIDYPNSWDRLRGRTGSGIWIHGTESDRYSRAPLSSLGCVTLSNADFVELRRHVEVDRTPVVVVNGASWASPEAVAAERRAVLDSLERWRQDWESRDTDRYLDHYAADFETEGMKLERFAAHKRRVNQGKRFIRVGLSQIAVYGYPGEDGLVLVEFLQRYESDSFRSERRKQQFWRRTGDRWRIVFEAKA